MFTFSSPGPGTGEGAEDEAFLPVEQGGTVTWREVQPASQILAKQLQMLASKLFQKQFMKLSD